MATRQSWRELAKTTIEALGVVTYEGARRRFDGRSPVCVVLSKGMQLIDLTRSGEDQFNNSITATFYVRADEDAEDAAEDSLDTLMRSAIVALKNAGFTAGESDAAPDGAPLRNIDGVFYRTERLSLTVEEYQ